jgi:four helix bundle protein
VNSSLGAKSFRELRVYQAAREAARRIFAISKTFPPEERYSLTDQIRKELASSQSNDRGSVGPPTFKAAFINKIDEAIGEANETQSLLDDALDAGYLSQEDFQDLDACYQAIGGMLSRMIDRADDFCKHGPATDYRSIVRDDGEPLFTAH